MVYKPEGMTIILKHIPFDQRIFFNGPGPNHGRKFPAMAGGWWLEHDFYFSRYMES